MGIYPTHLKRGEGAYLYDHKGKRYLDFIGGLGTNILGYGQDRVAQAISNELRNGYSHSFATHHEIEAAEKLKELMPFIDCVKFLKTGSEACSAAIRIARAATGRDLVLSDAYHGWHDDYVSLTEPALGVPRGPDYPRAISPLSRMPLSEKVAAVIIEPVITDWSEGRKAWLQKLRDDCTAYGIMLIHDEVICGLRWPRFSVSANWNITPDIIVLGKALANGMPLAAVGGKYAVMNGDYFVSSTYAGETLSLCAAKATMTQLQTRYDLNHLWDQGAAFLGAFNAIWPEKITIAGYPTRGAFAGDLDVRTLFFQEACEAGLLFGPSWFFNFAVSEETAGVMDVCRDILSRIRLGQVELRGEKPQAAFAAQVRGQR